jgi:Type II CAAX prenyl endopeptidase Rce1-like
VTPAAARAGRVEAQAARPAPAAAAVCAAGLAFLLLRPAAQALPAGRGTVLLGAGYLAVWAAAARVVVPAADRRAAPARSMAVLAVGLAAVLAAGALAGPAPPLRHGAAALPFGLVAAVAEEALLRRALYGWLARHGWPLAVAGSALAFALFHLPAYGVAAFPVDLGAGLLLSWQRWASGRWTVPAATHAAANLLVVMLG